MIVWNRQLLFGFNHYWPIQHRTLLKDNTNCFPGHHVLLLLVVVVVVVVVFANVLRTGVQASANDGSWWCTQGLPLAIPPWAGREGAHALKRRAREWRPFLWDDFLVGTCAFPDTQISQSARGAPKVAPLWRRDIWGGMLAGFLRNLFSSRDGTQPNRLLRQF